uniref:Uncharacterized protein n=1 Tax=Tanacetum cinerariifolium TaxID=118510 RepID=A0A6L2K3W6_TANCI|nr:hypothetical protein [Tanacetum cinerariifolium]
MAKFLEWSSGQATWSSGQGVVVVPKGLEWWPRCTLPTQGMRSIISTVSISPEGFMPSILLLVVIIVTVVIVVVTVILVVVVVAIIGVVIVVTIIGHSELLPDPLTSGLCLCFQSSSNTISNSLPDGSLSHSWCCRFDLTSDEDPTDENRDIGMGDSTGVSASLGGKIFSGGTKCQESNIGDSDNTRDGGKIVGGAIGACGGIDQLNTAYRSSDTAAEADFSYSIVVLDLLSFFRANPADIFTFVTGRANHAVFIKEETTKVMTELILNERMEKAQAESSLAKPNTDDDMNNKLNKEFLKELQSNAYYGMFDEDVVDHIAKVLERLDLIKIPYMESHRLRMKDGDNWGLDPLEFISRVNSIFKNHKRVDGMTKKHYCNDEECEESYYGNPPNTTTDSFFKPYLNAQEKNDIEKEAERSQKKHKGNNSNL